MREIDSRFLNIFNQKIKHFFWNHPVQKYANNYTDNVRLTSRLEATKGNIMIAFVPTYMNIWLKRRRVRKKMHWKASFRLNYHRKTLNVLNTFFLEKRKFVMSKKKAFVYQSFWYKQLKEKKKIWNTINMNWLSLKVSLIFSFLPFPSAASLPTTHPFFKCLSGYPTSLGSIIIYNYAVEPTLHLVLNLSFISGFEGYLG